MVVIDGFCGDGTTNHRVLRGGAFGNDRRFVRCAYRLNNFPDLRLNSIGFRVVVSPAAQGAA